MKRWFLLLGLTCSVCLTAEYGANASGCDLKWLCVSEKATGFAYRSGTWSQTNFRPDYKYLIRPLDEVSTGGRTGNEDYGVYQFGEAYPVFFCTQSFYEGFPDKSDTPAGYIYCSSMTGFFSFNMYNLRFTHAYRGGYSVVVPKINNILDEGADTPLIEIGTCSPL